MLSILIPTYNDECFGLVNTLQKQVESLALSQVIEIIVADDCSTDAAVRTANAKIDALEGCRVEWLPENLGRAGVRNHLASVAKGEWLLYIDSGNRVLSDDFVREYLRFIQSNGGKECVVYGGRKLGNEEHKGCLRYDYEKSWETHSQVEWRKKHSYSSFNTCNFLVPRSVMQRIPFNDKMKMYGFEDVLFGRQLKEADIPIVQIDNPVVFGTFESNAEFLRKTDESVRTQYDFRHEIGEYSTLINTHERLQRLHLTWVISLLNSLFKGVVKRNILGSRPSPLLFNVYKLMRYNELAMLIALLFCLVFPVSAQAQHVKPFRLREATMDITHGFVGSDRAFQGLQLPQAFDGSGVVLGVTDIGFDFTHPTFEESNIVAFWDLLSRDTLNSSIDSIDGRRRLFTGRDYDAEELRELQHSYDGFEQSHGTHVLGIAAGGSEKYRGIAPKADIVVVNNVLGNNYMMVDSLQKSKFDGNFDFHEFRYMFDKAAELGKPCVINISAGSRQSFGDDFDKYNQEMSALLGPGRILVASAGNNGGQMITLHKRRDQQSVGSRAYIKNSDVCYLFFQKEGDVECNFLYSNDRGETKHPLPSDMYESIDTISDYDGKDVRYYIFMHERMDSVGYQQLYVTLTGSGEGHLYTQGAQFLNSGKDDGFNDADNSYGLHFPACFDDVICVGGTNHRNVIVNWQGETKDANNGEIGKNYRHTSVGPRLDGYQKPDISAPGSCIISSYNSFYEEAHPDAGDVGWDKERFYHNGRTYSWNTNSGTSMSAPVVAGVIALWLQAKPDLTPQEIKDIFSRTARHPDPTLEYPNAIYGYGEIDAYAGLLDILGVSGIKEISHSQPTGVRFSMSDGNLILTFDESLLATSTTLPNIQLLVYTTDGRKLHSQNLTLNPQNSTFNPQNSTLNTPLSTLNTPLSIPLHHLPRGVYAIQLNSPDPRFRGSTLVRK